MSIEELNKNLGHLLAKYRQKANLTQGDVAAKIGRSRQQYGKYEAGIQPLSIPTIAQLADILGFEIKDLIRGATSVEFNKFKDMKFNFRFDDKLN